MNKSLIFLLFVFTLGAVTANAQINIVQNQPQERDTNEYFINGISTRFDIGGVDIQEKRTLFNFCNNKNIDGIAYIKLTNYNSFPVTVLFECDLYYYMPLSRDHEKKQYTVVLPGATDYMYPVREISLGYIPDGYNDYTYPLEIRNIVSITRQIGGK